jgi:endoglucanase
VPTVRWFGNRSGTIGTATGVFVIAAAAAGKRSILVAYNIPNRDICAGLSGGGAGSDAAYGTWIAAFASGIGNRPALVVLEPDSRDESCSDRGSGLRAQLTAAQHHRTVQGDGPNTWVCLDAGNPGWMSATTMAQHLAAAGMSGAHGFSLNVSNVHTTAQNTAYGVAVNAALL